MELNSFLLCLAWLLLGSFTSFVNFNAGRSGFLRKLTFIVLILSIVGASLVLVGIEPRIEW